jgi:glycerol-3-phosphate dehydrogenase
LRVPGRVGSHDAIWILPLSRGVLVGARRLPWSGPPGTPIVSEEDILGFLQTLRDAVPGWNPRLEHVLRVYAGLVPARHAGGAIAGPVFIDHGARGGPAGLYSVSGASYTSARLAAERSLCRIFGPRIRLAPREQSRPTPLEPPSIDEMVGPFRQHAPLRARVRQLCERESVVHLDDIVLRRTNWATCPQYLGEIAETVCAALGWDESRRISEKARLALALRQSGSVCSLAVPRPGERPPSHIGHSIA